MAGAAFGAEMTSFDYRNIVGIQLHKGMITGAILVQAPGFSATSTSIWRNSDSDPYKTPNAIPIGSAGTYAADGVAALRKLIAASQVDQTGTADAAASTPTSLAEELTKYVELCDSGAITAAEFDQLKRRLLSQ
jgi:hypothetical protein